MKNRGNLISGNLHFSSWLFLLHFGVGISGASHWRWRWRRASLDPHNFRDFFLGPKSGCGGEILMALFKHPQTKLWFSRGFTHIWDHVIGFLYVFFTHIGGDGIENSTKIHQVSSEKPNQLRSSPTSRTPQTYSPSDSPCRAWRRDRRASPTAPQLGLSQRLSSVTDFWTAGDSSGLHWLTLSEKSGCFCLNKVTKNNPKFGLTKNDIPCWVAITQSSQRLCCFPISGAALRARQQSNLWLRRDRKKPITTWSEISRWWQSLASCPLRGLRVVRNDLFDL